MRSRPFAVRDIGWPETEGDVPRRTIRLRITAVAAAAVAVVLAVAAITLVVQQRRALTSSLDHTLERRADDIVALLSNGFDVDAQIAAPGVSSDDENFVQMVDGRGEVVASSRNLADAPALQVSPPSNGRVTTNVAGLTIDDDTFRVLSLSIGDHVLHVGTAFEVVDEGTQALIVSLAVTTPTLVTLLAAMVWWLVGRTLRPVEAIRAEVAEIGSLHLDRRVPQPGTDDEVDRLAATMNQMLTRLEDAVERQQRFVADASHELRSPLTRLRAELELALRSESKPDDAERLDSLLTEVAAMQAMVDDLLHLAQADAHRISHEPVPIDLDDIVFEEGSRLSADRRVPIDLTGVSGAQVQGDPSQLARAIDNLLDNATRHAHTRVVVTLGEEDDTAVFTVTDDGPGIPAEHADKVFERFGRVDEARTAGTGGTGLGLAIAREIVERHGGTIRLTNAGQRGAVFEMRLPVTG